MKYEESQSFSRDEVESAISADEVDALIEMVVAVSMQAEDSAWAESVCLRLAAHSNCTVRGNAVLGFGHIARIHRKIKHPGVAKLLQEALYDPHQYVRGQASVAADDVQHFLGWKLAGKD